MSNEPKKNRTQITWKLDRLSKKQQEQANKWADQQQNIQTSISNIILHMIDRYGYVDFMDFDVQRELFKENFSSGSIEIPLQNSEETNAPQNKKVDVNNNIVDNNNNDDDDDLYNEDLMNNL